jgi:hypothetical protein
MTYNEFRRFCCVLLLAIPVLLFDVWHHLIEWWHFRVSNGVLSWTRKTKKRIRAVIEHALV